MPITPRTTGQAGGFDSQFGLEIPRTVPPAIAVETTSVYSEETGYDWAELRGAPGAGFAAPDLRRVGNMAYPISGQTDLPIGTRCLMTIDLDQTIYSLWVSATPPGSGSGSGSAFCNASYPSIRLPCEGSGSGSEPLTPPGCFEIIAGGVIYFPCAGLDDPRLIIVACDNEDVVTLPYGMQVTAQNGTRSFEPVGTVTGNAAHSNAIWPISITGNGFRLTGYLAYCCQANPPGLYFVGSVASSHNDPDEPPDPEDFWCGCARNITACPPCNQEIVSGPTFDPLAETLRLDVGCGTIDLVIGPCATIAGFTGAGYYCVLNPLTELCEPLELTEANRCDTSITLCSVRFDTFEEAEAACSGSGSGPPFVNCCPDAPLPTGGQAQSSASPCGAEQTSDVQIFQTGQGQILVGTTGFGSAFLRCNGEGNWTSTLTILEAPEIEGDFVSADCGVSSITVVFEYLLNTGPCAGFTITITWILTW